MKLSFNRIRGAFPAFGVVFERQPTTDWVWDDIQRADPYENGHWETRAVYIFRIGLWWAEWELRYTGAIYSY